MIDEFVPRGEVDIVYQFGRIFPVRVFLDLMGMPFEMFEQFLDWEYKILLVDHNAADDVAVKTQAMKEVLAYLHGFVAEKQADPDDKLGSYIANGSINGKPLTPDEIMGMTFLMWLGGLDTVASTISQMMRRLALDPELQERLRVQPELVPKAVEEFLRFQPLINSGRFLKKDLDWHGVTMRKGDLISCLTSSGNFDETKFVHPRTFDPAREPNRHFTLAAGIHICLGAHLARRELRVALKEVLARIPTFRLKDGADLSVTPGMRSVRRLPLVWQTGGPS
jgi:cytochrome P450